MPDLHVSPADRNEIYDVLVRYCRGIDRLDRDVVRSCYHPGAVDEHGLYDGTVEEFIENAFTRQATVDVASHCIHNVMIEKLDESTAVCESYANATERSREDDGTLIDTVVGLRYVDRFERRDDGPWLIAHRIVVIDWSRRHVVDEGWVGAASMTRGARSTADPIYAALSGK